jgi:hypothetical protein
MTYVVFAWITGLNIICCQPVLVSPLNVTRAVPVRLQSVA